MSFPIVKGIDIDTLDETNNCMDVEYIEGMRQRSNYSHIDRTNTMAMTRGFRSGFAKAMIFRKLDAVGAGDSSNDCRKDGSNRVMRVSRGGFAW